MSGTWKSRQGDCEITIDADALSGVLASTCTTSVNLVGVMAANAARNAAAPADQRFIFLKNTQEFDLQSGRLPKLSQMLRVPVALVVNNSAFAAEMEYGTSRTHPRRPLGRAFDALRGMVAMSERGR